MDGIDAVINTLVHAFYAAYRVHLPLQALGLPAGGEALQLADKLTAFFDGEEFGGLYRVYQQLQLRQLELPVGKLVATRSAAGGDDIHAVILQRTEIIVDAFALGVHAQFLQPGQDVAHRKRVVFVRFPAQQVGQVQQLQFLSFAFRHPAHPLQCFFVEKIENFFNLFYTGIIACPMRDGKEPPSVRGREKEGERCLDHRYVPGETRRHPVAVHHPHAAERGVPAAV